MELAILVWCSWNMTSPEKKVQTVRIELIGQDLFKYEGDRIEKVGSMWEAKRWMKEDWNECMAGIELRRQIDYREVQKVKKGVTE